MRVLAGSDAMEYLLMQAMHAARSFQKVLLEEGKKSQTPALATSRLKVSQLPQQEARLLTYVL